MAFPFDSVTRAISLGLPFDALSRALLDLARASARGGAGAVGPVVLRSGSSERSFLTIGAALAAARPGDTVALYPGTYQAAETIPVDRLSIVGLGEDPSDVVIVAALPAAPALQYVAPAVGTAPFTLFTLRNVTVASAGDVATNPTLAFDGSAQSAAGGLPVFGSATDTTRRLALESVLVRSGTVSITACGKVQIDGMGVTSNDVVANGAMTLAGNAEVEVTDSTTANVTVSYAAPCSVLPQVGTFFRRCLLTASAEANLALFGSPVVLVDEECVVPVRGTNFTGASVLGFMQSAAVVVAGVSVNVDPYVTFRGTVGAVSVGAPSGSIAFTSSFLLNFGAATPFATSAGPGAAQAWGFDGDGATFYCPMIVFAPDFGAKAFDPLVHRLTANDASFFQGVLLTGASPVGSRPRFQIHGSTINPVGRPNGVQVRDGIDLDLRGSTFSPDELLVTGSGAIDRSVVVLPGEPNVAPGQTVTFNALQGNLVPFPSYVDGTTVARSATVSTGAASNINKLPATLLAQSYGPLRFTYTLAAQGPGDTVDFVVNRP